MRVLVSAYACAPHRGSEPGAGWAFACAAAQIADEVVVLTRRRRRREIESGGAPSNVTFEYHELGPVWLRIKRLPFGDQIYYAKWQRSLKPVLRRLAAQHAFDVAHHVTFATDWLPVGLVHLRTVPFVWGPIGGATRTPSVLRGHLSWRGRAFEVVRGMATRLGQRHYGFRAARSAAIVVAQNDDEVRVFGRAADEMVVHPNVVVPEPDNGRAPEARAPRSLICVGRLEEFKGIAVVLDALGVAGLEDWTLTIYGEGPDRGRLEAMVTRMGLQGRVTFMGQVDRQDVAHAMRSATALVAPCFHEAAGFAVAEALTAGCPVIATAHGGHRVLLAAGGGTLVEPTADMSAGIAKAVLGLTRGVPSAAETDWTARRLPGFLRATYEAAIDLDRSRRTPDGEKELKKHADD